MSHRLSSNTFPPDKARPTTQRSYISPSGCRYRVTRRLSPAQQDTLGQIIDHGRRQGHPRHTIRIVAALAQVDTALGEIARTMPGSTSPPILRYPEATWRQWHGSLHRGMRRDQLTAIFHDIARYRALFPDALARHQIAATMPFPTYVALRYFAGCPVRSPTANSVHSAQLRRFDHAWEALNVDLFDD